MVYAYQRNLYLQNQWTTVYDTSKEWVARMTTLVECWNKLEGNVDELSSWVNKDGTVGTPEGVQVDPEKEISIEKLEGQLNQLKIMFAEKQRLVADLEAYGPSGQEEGHENHHEPAEVPTEEAPPPAEAEAADPAAEAPAEPEA